MPLWIPAAIAGAASLIGGALRNKAEKKAAQTQMDFQERMSSTSYQRATEDMKLSGINPMLAYQQGGASSPGGAMASMEDVVGPAVSSAMHARRLQSELRTMQMQQWNIDADTKYKNAQHIKTQAETDYIQAERKGREIENVASGAGLYRLLNEARVEKSWLGKATPWVDKVRETIFPFLMLGKQGGPMGAPFGRGGSSIRGRY